jgi:hypothetical protein
MNGRNWCKETVIAEVDLVIVTGERKVKIHDATIRGAVHLMAMAMHGGPVFAAEQLC